MLPDSSTSGVGAPLTCQAAELEEAGAGGEPVSLESILPTSYMYMNVRIHVFTYYCSFNLLGSHVSPK
jgi:hypothetical protein